MDGKSADCTVIQNSTMLLRRALLLVLTFVVPVGSMLVTVRYVRDGVSYVTVIDAQKIRGEGGSEWVVALGDKRKGEEWGTENGI